MQQQAGDVCPGTYHEVCDPWLSTCLCVRVPALPEAPYVRVKTEMGRNSPCAVPLGAPPASA